MSVIDMDDVQSTISGFKSAPKNTLAGAAPRFKIPAVVNRQPVAAPVQAPSAAPAERSFTQVDLSGSKLAQNLQRRSDARLSAPLRIKPTSAGLTPVAQVQLKVAPAEPAAPVVTPESALAASVAQEQTALVAAQAQMKIEDTAAQDLISAANAASLLAAAAKNALTQQTATPIEQQKRGRGRPRKVDAVAPNMVVRVPVAQITSSAPLPSIAQEASAVPIKRGRGRPRKVDVAQTTPVQSPTPAPATVNLIAQAAAQALAQSAQAEPVVQRAFQRVVPQFVSPLQGLELRAEEQRLQEEAAIQAREASPEANPLQDETGFLKFAAAALAGEKVEPPVRPAAPEAAPKPIYTGSKAGRKPFFKTQSDMDFLRHMAQPAKPVDAPIVAPTWAKSEAWKDLSVKRSFEDAVPTDAKVYTLGGETGEGAPLLHEDKVNFSALRTMVPAMSDMIKKLESTMAERMHFAENQARILKEEYERGYEQGQGDWQMAQHVVLETRRQVARHIENDVRYHSKLAQTENFPYREILQFAYPMLSDIALASAEDIMSVAGMDLKKLNAVITYFEMKHLMHLITSARLKMD